MSPNDHLTTARNLTLWLDNKFSFLGYKFGLDPVVGLIPVFGDFIPDILGVYIIWVGWRMKLPKQKIFVMIRRSVMDFIIGLIPFLGDIWDFYYKANEKNLREIEKHLTSK